jgi:hypothetical protein
MDLAKVLVQLREELSNLDAAIVSLERLQEGAKKRGRPPAWLAGARKAERTSRKPREEAPAGSTARK